MENQTAWESAIEWMRNRYPNDMTASFYELDTKIYNDRFGCILCIKNDRWKATGNSKAEAARNAAIKAATELGWSNPHAIAECAK